VKFEEGSPDAVPELERWTRRALELDPEDGLAWATKFNLERARPEGHQVDSTTELEWALRAAALAPESFLAQNAVVIASPSDLLGLAASQELARRFPLLLIPRLNIAQILLFFGQAGEALSSVDAVLRVEPELAFAQLDRTSILLDLGRRSRLKSSWRTCWPSRPATPRVRFRRPGSRPLAGR